MSHDEPSGKEQAKSRFSKHTMTMLSTHAKHAEHAKSTSSNHMMRMLSKLTMVKKLAGQQAGKLQSLKCVDSWTSAIA